MPEKAEITGDVYEIPGQEDSFEKYYFHLRDNVHEFTMGLSDILECLKFAETEGIVPPLPLDWWAGIAGIYPDNNAWLDITDD